MTDWLDKTGEHLKVIDESLLPPLAQELVSLIGLSQTLKLLKARGGVRTFIPSTVRQGSQLAQIVSMQSVAVLVEHFGGDRLDFPKVDQLVRQLRNQSLIKDSQEGKSHAEIAQKYKLTRERVKQILREINQPRPQNMELF